MTFVRLLSHYFLWCDCSNIDHPICAVCDLVTKPPHGLPKASSQLLLTRR